MNYPAASGRGIKEPPHKAEICAPRGGELTQKRLKRSIVVKQNNIDSLDGLDSDSDFSTPLPFPIRSLHVNFTVPVDVWLVTATIKLQQNQKQEPPAF